MIEVAFEKYMRFHLSNLEVAFMLGNSSESTLWLPWWCGFESEVTKMVLICHHEGTV